MRFAGFNRAVSPASSYMDAYKQDWAEEKAREQARRNEITQAMALGGQAYNKYADTTGHDPIADYLRKLAPEQTSAPGTDPQSGEVPPTPQEVSPGAGDLPPDPNAAPIEDIGPGLMPDTSDTTPLSDALRDTNNVGEVTEQVDNAINTFDTAVEGGAEAADAAANVGDEKIAQAMGTGGDVLGYGKAALSLAEGDPEEAAKQALAQYLRSMGPYGLAAGTLLSIV